MKRADVRRTVGDARRGRALRPARDVRVHGVPRRRARGDHRRDRPPSSPAMRRVVLRRDAARVVATALSFDHGHAGRVRSACGRSSTTSTRSSRSTASIASRCAPRSCSAGRNRELAAHVARHLRAALPQYEAVDNLKKIPVELQGLHERNPVNVPRNAGVQIELPPRARGVGTFWADHKGDSLVPHTRSLIDGLVAAVDDWTHRADAASPAPR